MEHIDKAENEWGSGKWAVSEETDQNLVGGMYIYLHNGQDKPPHLGGKILSFRAISIPTIRWESAF